MTPATFGLTLVTFAQPANAATVPVTHHSVRLAVLLAVVLGAFGFSQPSADAATRLAADPKQQADQQA